MGLQYGHCLLHRAGSLHHLGQKHLATAEKLSHGVHAVHQRTLDDVHRLGIYGESLGEVFLKMFAYTLDEGVLQSLGER